MSAMAVWKLRRECSSSPPLVLPTTPCCAPLTCQPACNPACDLIPPSAGGPSGIDGRVAAGQEVWRGRGILGVDHQAGERGWNILGYQDIPYLAFPAHPTAFSGSTIQAGEWGWNIPGLNRKVVSLVALVLAYGSSLPVILRRQKGDSFQRIVWKLSNRQVAEGQELSALKESYHRLYEGD